jgi:hypothetical protein
MADAKTLAAIIADLEPAQRDALSGIHVTMDKGTAVARLSISLFGPIGFGRSTGGITVDTANLPDGVSVGGAERHPDIVRSLTTDTPLDEQIAALRESGIVGGVDAARVGPDKGGYRWTIKTHAGSSDERAVWATRGVRMGRPPLMEDATRWEITLPADLKAWALGNGGAKLVRELLERERADAAR